MKEFKKIRTPIAEVSLRDGIMYSEVYADDVDVAALKVHNDEIIKEFGAILPRPFVVTTKQGAKPAGKEVRDFMNTEEFMHTTKSLAMLSGSGLSRAVVNLFLKFARLPVPVKMFSTVEEATEWSRQYR